MFSLMALLRGENPLGWWLLHSVFCSFAAITYVLLPMPLLFFAGSDGSSMFSESDNR
jgi:hypothetical protein